MQRVNVEGLYAAVQASLPHLLPQPTSLQQKQNGGKRGGGGRIVIVSPPIYSRFFRGKTAYAMGKVGMSVLTMGLGMDFERQGVVRDGEGGCAVTSIWPAVVSIYYYHFLLILLPLLSFSLRILTFPQLEEFHGMFGVRRRRNGKGM